MMPGMIVLFNLCYVVVISIGGYQVANKALTVGELTQFFIYLNQLLWPVAAIGWVTSMIQRGAASMGRLSTIMDTIPDIKNSEHTDRNIKDIQGTVTFNNVGLTYKQRSESSAPAQRTLHDINIKILRGSSLGILGGVGSGKSSLVNLIPRLYEASEGTVLIDGHDVKTIPLEVLRAHVAVVPQESFLFSDSIAGNIMFGRPDATESEMLHAARIAQLDADVAAMPQGYDTRVGERGITLSGGQKQRTAIARAVLCNPSILILDDALSAVDTDTEARILHGLIKVMHGRTSIVIAHRISTLKHCDTIAVLDNGTIVEYGNHDELIALGGRYASTYERQLLEAAIE